VNSFALFALLDAEQLRSFLAKLFRASRIGRISIKCGWRKLPALSFVGAFADRNDQES
jgi:hypothetical protein